MPWQGFHTTYASFARVAWHLCISGNSSGHLGTRAIMILIMMPLCSVLMPWQGFRTTYALFARVAWHLCISGNSSGHLGAKHVRAILIMMTLVIFYKVQWSMGKLTLCLCSCRMSCRGKKTQANARMQQRRRKARSTLKKSPLAEEARPRDNANLNENDLSLLDILYDNAFQSKASVSAMPVPPPPSPPPPPPTPSPPPPQDAALPRAVRRLVMMENQHTADSSPPPIEESFPDLTTGHSRPPLNKMQAMFVKKRSMPPCQAAKHC